MNFYKEVRGWLAKFIKVPARDVKTVFLTKPVIVLWKTVIYLLI